MHQHVDNQKKCDALEKKCDAFCSISQ